MGSALPQIMAVVIGALLMVAVLVTMSTPAAPTAPSIPPGIDASTVAAQSQPRPPAPMISFEGGVSNQKSQSPTSSPSSSLNPKPDPASSKRPTSSPPPTPRGPDIPPRPSAPGGSGGMRRPPRRASKDAESVIPDIAYHTAPASGPPYEQLLGDGMPFLSHDSSMNAPLHPDDINAIVAIYKRHKAAALANFKTNGSSLLDSETDEVIGKPLGTDPETGKFIRRDVDPIAFHLRPSCRRRAGKVHCPDSTPLTARGCRQGVVLFPFSFEVMAVMDERDRKKQQARKSPSSSTEVNPELLACGQRLANAALLRRTHPDEQYRRHVASRVGPWYFKALVMSGVDVAPATQIFVPQACAYVFVGEAPASSCGATPSSAAIPKFEILTRYREYGATKNWTGAYWAEPDRHLGRETFTVKALPCPVRRSADSLDATHSVRYLQASTAVPSTTTTTGTAVATPSGNALTPQEVAAAAPAPATPPACSIPMTWPPPLCTDIGMDTSVGYSNVGRYLVVPARGYSYPSQFLRYWPWIGKQFQYVYEVPTAHFWPQAPAPTQGDKKSSRSAATTVPEPTAPRGMSTRAASAVWRSLQVDISPWLAPIPAPTTDAFNVSSQRLSIIDPHLVALATNATAKEIARDAFLKAKGSFWGTALPGRVMCRASPFSRDRREVMNRCHSRRVVFTGDSQGRNLFRHMRSVIGSVPLLSRNKIPPPWHFEKLMFAMPYGSNTLQDIDTLAARVSGFHAVILNFGHWPASPRCAWTLGEAMLMSSFVARHLTQLIKKASRTKFIWVLSPSRPAAMDYRTQVSMTDARLSLQNAAMAVVMRAAGAAVVDEFGPTYPAAAWNRKDDGVHHDSNGAMYATIDAILDIVCPKVGA